MNPKKKLVLRSYENERDAAYLELADHPHQLTEGIIHKTVYVHELIPNYDGPELILGFNQAGRAIGLEILYPYEEFYDDEDSV
jgi:hypothetical protein